MKYDLFISRTAQKELSEIPKEIAFKIKEKIIDLSEDPHPPDIIKLKDRDGWRIRFGNYRVIYQINNDDKKINILHIGPRKDVYK